MKRGAVVRTVLALAATAWLCSGPPRGGAPSNAHALEAAADSQVSNPAPPGLIAPPACDLCARDDQGVPIRTLDVEQVKRIGRMYADSNVVRLAWIDSVLRAGAFGKSTSPVAKRQAHMLARMLTLNAYSYMIRFATDPDTIWEANEESMAPAFASFSDPGIVPLARLKRARMGRGRMCADYDLAEKVHSEIVLGGRRLSIRIDDVRIQGQTVRVLIMDLPTSLHDVVEVWITDHVCIDVEHFESSGPPAPYEAFILDNMRGLWVHRGGIHRPQAFVFWVTPRHTLGTKLPKRPLVGARIYVPRLRLRLPGILPDIGFEDLREVDLPQPILALDFIKDGRQPSWIVPSGVRGFRNWEGFGPLPPAIRRRFPNL